MSIIDLLPQRSVGVVYGTRPEMIKLAPLVHILGDVGVLIHTGQHYENNLVDIVADDLALPIPEITLGIGARSRATQIGMAMSALESPLDRVRAVVVQGDTNSALAGGLVANAMEKPLFHVEAGLRSYDRRMPEEHNRVLLDHLADICWAPTVGNQQNLLAEGIDGSRIQVTGNTIVESLKHLLPEPEARAATLARLGLVSEQYVLATIHRPENVDDPLQLQAIVKALGEIPMPVYLPAHPRTVAQLDAMSSMSVASSITIVPPLGYRDFLSLLAECGFAISDSGGVQEEVSLLKIPMIALRRSTERPEVIGTFATLLSDPVDVVREARRLIETLGERKAELRGLETPFGDGHSAQRMADSLVRHMSDWSE